MFILTLLYYTPGFAQKLEDIRFETIDEKSGLSNNWITHLAIDSSGYLWVATQDGLNRFDGFTFKTFKHDKNNPNSLLHNNGQELYVAPNGDLWISYHEGGFSRYQKDLQNFKHYDIPNFKLKYQPDIEFAIRYMDGDGSIWYSGSGLGLNHYNYEKDQHLHYDLPDIIQTNNIDANNDPNTVNYIYSASDNQLWLCTENGLYGFNPKTKSFSLKTYEVKHQSMVQEYNFSKLIPDGNKGFWLSAYVGGIYYFDLKNETFSNYKFDSIHTGFYNLVFDMTEKSPEEFWIAAGDKGLGIFNKTLGQFQFPENAPNHRPYAFLEQVIQTSNHELLIADETSLLKYSPSAARFNFRYLPLSHSQHGNLHVIRKILEHPEVNEIYFATEFGNGLNILNTLTQKLTALPVAVDKSKDTKMILNGLLKDTMGKYWLLCRDFIYEFDWKHKKLIQIPQPFKHPEINERYNFKSFLQNYKGEIFSLTREGNLYPFSTSERKFIEKISAFDRQHRIRKIDFAVFDATHRLWVLGEKKLAYRNDPKSAFKFVSDSILLQYLHSPVKAMVSDSIGNIWMAIEHQGLLKLNINNSQVFSYHLFTSPVELPNTRINNMGIDPQGHIWMSTINGIVWFNPSTRKYKLFNQLAGVDKYIFGMRFMIAGPHSFYITTPGKYCKVDFNQLNQASYIPKVYIDKMNIGKKEVPVTSDKQTTFTLKPNENYFSFDFGCIDFSDQSYHHFAYQLLGWDKTWQDCGTRRYANYTNVSGGDYVFMVKVANTEGQWSDVAKLNIYIQTPFYKTWWFKLLLAALVSLILFSLYQYRINQQRQMFDLKSRAQLLEKEKTMVMYESLKQQLNPHFLFNSLTSLSGLIETDPSLAGEFLEQMSDIYRYILKHDDRETVLLRDEIEFAKLYVRLQQTRFTKGLYVEFDIPEEYEDTKIAPVTIQNMIENALKHNIIGEHLPLRIEIYIEDDYIVVKNNLQKKNKVETSNKKGLPQFVNLYKFLSDRPVLIDESNTHFIVRIPLI